MANKKVVLIIRDGWGRGKADKYNAVANASTPAMDKYLAEYPHTVLEPAGEYVGLPEGYQGSSEVGHLNMGAGRIVIQELKRIKDMIKDGTFFACPALKKAFDNAAEKGTAIHFMGLVQDEGVHAHQDHLYALLKEASRRGIKQAWIHYFADGRDTPPRSTLSYLKMLQEIMMRCGNAKVATVMGRYYAMDRGAKWPLTDKAYACITRCEGTKYASAEDAIKYGYENLKNPDGTPMSDEYLPPAVIGDYPGIKEGDSVVHFNFRQDRAIQLTKAFVEDEYPGNRDKKYNIVYCGLTRYYNEFKFSALPAMDEGGGMENLLGEVISQNGLKQLRLAETQKFKHVTSFFNGKSTKPYPGEDQVEIKGTWDPATFAEHPEMNAPEVRERAIQEINAGKYDFIAINFANCDMVGHTGDYNAAKKAVEVTDESVKMVTEAALAKDYSVLITSDHGNAEEMWDYKIDMPRTSHTVNQVDFIYLANDAAGIKLRPHGILSDIAPTVLQIMGLKQPKEMTSQSLLA